jgi:hypothetical protein
MMLGPPATRDTAIIITNINNENNGNDDDLRINISKDDDVFDLSSLNLFTASLPTTRFHLSPPHLETLSTSTTSSTTTDDNPVDHPCTGMTMTTNTNTNTNTTTIVNNKDHNNNNAEEFHDCSSSVSSQETSNSSVNANTNTSTSADHYSNSNSNSNKRSVFTQYWMKTGQKPIPIRSMRSSFSSTTSLIHTCDIGSVNTNFLSSYSSPHPPSPSPSITANTSSSSLPLPLSLSSFHEQDDSQLLCSVSNADLLEGDTVARSGADDATSIITTPKGTDKRRRSILPPRNQNHPAITTDTDLTREVMAMNTSSWRKSSSLSSLQQRGTRYNNNGTIGTNNIHHNHQHRSLTKLSSTTTPSTSCLRSLQRYSPSKNDTAAATAVINTVMDSSSLNLSASTSTSSVLSVSSTSSTASSCSSSSSVSSTSNVRFDLEVDVRHFEPPKEKYAQKGWSGHFH